MTSTLTGVWPWVRHAVIAVGLSNAGRDYSLGWRLARGGGGPDGSALELAVEARRRESTANRRMPPEHALDLRVISRF